MLDFVKNIFKKGQKGHDVMNIGAYEMGEHEHDHHGHEHAHGGCCGGHSQAKAAGGGCCGGAEKKAEEKAHGSCGCSH